MRSIRPTCWALLAVVAGCATSPSGTASRASSGASSRAASVDAAPLVVVAAAEPREQTADQQVQQVLSRLGFGPRPGDVARVRAMGVDQWIALQLAPNRIDDEAADALVASYEGLQLSTSELVAMYLERQQALREARRRAAQGGGDSNGRRETRAELPRDDPALRERLRRSQRSLGDVQSARLARAVASERQLQEVMTDFWSNHFTVFAGKGLTRLFIPAYEREVIRPHALGSFRDLLGAVAKSPAMLFYLDQWQSAADSLHPTLAGARRPARRRRGLNENYARELLELHTLGGDGGYAQQDVIEVARALTGWTMNPRVDGAFVFRPEIHDAGAKTVLGHRLAAGRGIEDGEQVLDILARDPRTARFIARKLVVRFVSDDPPPALVERAARTFVRTDGDIREVVRTIVTSPEFFSRTAYRSKVKSPFELVASALRAVGAAPDTSMRSAQMVAFLGQPLYGHQAPNGWPETGESWMNTGAILNRINFGLALAAGRLPNTGAAQWPEAARLRTASREEQVDAAIASFLGGNASPDTRQILLDGENPLLARLGGADTTITVPMRARDVAPARDGRPRAPGLRGLAQPVRLTGLAQVVGLAIGAPEFQRR
jgi:uncharacterized protein (DUF1800 family)